MGNFQERVSPHHHRKQDRSTFQKTIQFEKQTSHTYWAVNTWLVLYTDANNPFNVSKPYKPTQQNSTQHHSTHSGQNPVTQLSSPIYRPPLPWFSWRGHAHLGLVHVHVYPENCSRDTLSNRKQESKLPFGLSEAIEFGLCVLFLIWRLLLNLNKETSCLFFCFVKSATKHLILGK